MDFMERREAALDLERRVQAQPGVFESAARWAKPLACIALFWAVALSPWYPQWAQPTVWAGSAFFVAGVFASAFVGRR